MAHVVSLTDGTTTLNFTLADGCMITAYDMKADGNDTIEVLLTAASKTALQAVINNIERMFVAAKRRADTQRGPKVYINFQVDAEAASNRSLIKSGKLELDESALKSGWPNIKVDARLYIERDPWWEGPETELLIASKASTTPATGGKSIHNQNDSGEGNYIQIAAAQITGTLPTPVKIQMQNTSGGALQYPDLYIATNSQSDPANFVHMLEVEDALSGGTITVSASSSAGNYLALTVNTTAAIAIPIPAATVAACNGRHFRLLLRQPLNPSGTVYVTPQIRDSAGLSAYATGAEIKIIPTAGNELVDLGSLPIPDAGGDATGWGALTLYLSFRSLSSQTWYGDCIQLTPTESIRRLIQRDETVGNNAYLVDDPIDGAVYRLASSVKYPNFIAQEDPPTLWPNLLQRMYFFSSIAPDKTMTVKMWIRPRRETV